MDIKEAFPRVAKGRLVYMMQFRQMERHHIRWMESILLARMVEMVIESYIMEQHPVEAMVPQGPPVSPIVFAIYTSRLIKWVEDLVLEAEGLSVVDDVRWEAPGSDVNHVVSILERCAATRIEGESIHGLQFATAKTGGTIHTQTRPQETPPAKTDSKDKSRNEVGMVQHTGDRLAGNVGGCRTDEQSTPQPID
jgi:hypothetical protein